MTSPDPTDPFTAAIAAAWRAIGSGPILVVTGAGISAASGVSTFRGSEPEAIWKTSDIEMATVQFFHRDPVAQWSWYLARFRRLDDAEPNAAHRALADLESLHADDGGRLTVLTQNIDVLHERAGSRRLIKVHGSSDRVRCSRTGCRHGAPAGSLARADVDLASFVEDPSPATLPATCRIPI